MDDIEIRTHTALHVVKGAVRKVLGAKWTASTWVSKGHGRITVQLFNKPGESDMKEIFRLANEKIVEGVPVKMEVLSREEAEKKYGDEIYDLFPIPAEVKELKIVIIEGWSINACNKPHTSTTAEIGEIEMCDWRFRRVKNLLEVSFNLKKI
jgi:alanyl-tRNA synthetase